VPVTEQQFEAVCRRLESIATDIGHLTHGNGRTGVHALLDDIYGPPNGNRRGLIARVVVLESEVDRLSAQRKETRWLQRGIAIGVALVLVEGAFNIEIARVIAAWFGAH
jgi:hypothetical protein